MRDSIDAVLYLWFAQSSAIRLRRSLSRRGLAWADPYDIIGAAI